MHEEPGNDFKFSIKTIFVCLFVYLLVITLPFYLNKADVDTKEAALDILPFLYKEFIKSNRLVHAQS